MDQVHRGGSGLGIAASLTTRGCLFLHLYFAAWFWFRAWRQGEETPFAIDSDLLVFFFRSRASTCEAVHARFIFGAETGGEWRTTAFISPTRTILTGKPMLFPQSRNAVLLTNHRHRGGDTAYELRVLSFRGPPAQDSVAKRVGEEDAADRHRRRVDAPLKESRSFPLRRGYQAGAKTSCHLSLAEAAGQSQRGITVGQVWHIPGSTLVGLSACPKKAWRPLSRGVEEGPWASWSGVTASVDMLGSLVTR